MDMTTGQIHEMQPGEDLTALAARLSVAVGNLVELKGKPDPNCIHCHGRGSEPKGMGSKRFVPCRCVS